MSKNKRKRRIKEEDFKKKKLKVGKKLPMPDNVTQTSFKAGRIHIGQQNLKQDGGQNESNIFKGQKLKDLLNSCSHYNTQAREDALLGLKDLIERYPGALRVKLNEVLQKILVMVTDIEFPVRKAFVAVMSMLFRTFSQIDVSPFFANIVAYLCSAMTHLNENIRLDSMKFLDICLQYFPQLIQANSKNIILNFMNVISTEKSSSSKSSRITKMVAFAAKVTSQKTQLEVLSRLNHLLQVVFADVSSTSESNDVSLGKDLPIIPHSVHIGDIGNTIISRSTFTGEVPDSGPNPIGYPNGARMPTTGSYCNDNPIIMSDTFDSATPFTGTLNPTLVSNFSLKSASGDMSESQASSTDIVMNETWLMEFMSTLAPVLFEYWVECCPAQFSMNLIPVKGASLSLQIMKEILEIFVTLVGSLEKNVLEQTRFLEFLNGKLFSQFNTHFVKVFPLSFMLQQSGRRSKKVESAEGITDVQLNVLIAQLLSYFIPELQQDVNDLPRWASEVLTYLQNVLVSKKTNRQSQLTVLDIRSLTKLVKMFLLNLPKNSESLKVQLLQSMYQLFQGCHATSSTKKVLLDFLAEIVDGGRHHYPAMKAILDEWLKSLLKLLHNKDINEEVKYKIFFVCKSGILQRFTNLTIAMTDELPEIFEVENFSKLSEEVQQLVIENLYHIHQAPSHQLFEVLSRLCLSDCLSLQVFKYLMLVTHKLLPLHTSPLFVPTTADYLSFMMSVAVGHGQSQLVYVQHVENHPNSFNHEVSKQNTLVLGFQDENSKTSKESWEHGNQVIKIICQFLSQSVYSARFLEMMADPLCELFLKYKSLPLEVVYRLLYLVKTLLCVAKEGGCVDYIGVLLPFAAKWCALIWCFSLTVVEQFEQVKFAVHHLKAVTTELCGLSDFLVTSILDSFVPCTAPGCDSQLTCQVLTDMLKKLQGSLTPDHQSTLQVLYQNLERASQAGLLDSQTFSDFKYQFQSSRRFSNV